MSIIRTKRVWSPTRGIPVGATNAVSSEGTFVNADLDASFILNISHNLSRSVTIEIIAPDDKHEATIDIITINTDKVNVDFGGPIGAGTWTWKAIG